MGPPRPADHPPAMATPGSRSLVQLVVVLVLTGAARSAWHVRTAPAPVGPGTAVTVAAVADSAARLAEAEARRSRPLGDGERLDPNRAPEEELDRLPGVGPATAAAVRAARDTLAFASADDLLRVRGVGPATLERIRPHLEVGPAPVVRTATSRRRGRRGGVASVSSPASAQGEPVDLNRATAAELESLPGVGPVLAERILAWRDRNGPFPGVDALLEVSGVGPATLERLRSRIRVR